MSDDNFQFDQVTRDLTAFTTWRELLTSHESYRPTILPRDERHVDLADAFDAAMADRGSSRRAWRGAGEWSNITPTSPEGFLSVRFGGVPTGSGLASDWLRAIWSINTAARADGLEQIIGSPTGSYETPYGFTEEYPEFRVILRHTAWGNGENSGTIQAKTEDAERRLRNAAAEILGRELPLRQRPHVWSHSPNCAAMRLSSADCNCTR